MLCQHVELVCEENEVHELGFLLKCYQILLLARSIPESTISAAKALPTVRWRNKG
jgi:hypothetical protein